MKIVYKVFLKSYMTKLISQINSFKQRYIRTVIRTTQGRKFSKSALMAETFNPLECLLYRRTWATNLTIPISLNQCRLLTCSKSKLNYKRYSLQNSTHYASMMIRIKFWKSILILSRKCLIYFTYKQESTLMNSVPTVLNTTCFHTLTMSKLRKNMKKL